MAGWGKLDSVWHGCSASSPALGHPGDLPEPSIVLHRPQRERTRGGEGFKFHLEKAVPGQALMLRAMAHSLEQIVPEDPHGAKLLLWCPELSRGSNPSGVGGLPLSPQQAHHALSLLQEASLD